jgi:hypothetical protein
MNLLVKPQEVKLVPIHTSDRGLYRNCRRRWIWGSHLNRGLEPVKKAAPLWFGEGIHYALKDFHGPKLLPTIQQSFEEFSRLSYETYPDRLPDNFDDLRLLGKGMLDHYERWLERRDPLETHVVDGVPQVEVTFEIRLPINPELLALSGIDIVVYRGTFDRISIDRQMNALWIVEYKTAAQLEQGALLVDPQVSAYMWAASCVYDLPIAGVIYQQHWKNVPKPARILKNGTVSAAQNQLTNHRLYRQALVDVYGDPRKSSDKHVMLLNQFAYQETTDKDRFIQRTKVYRNQHQIEAEGEKIIMEVEEMINPNTPMYPAPGRNCLMCPFMSPCASIDDGSDFEAELNDRSIYNVRSRASSEWEILSHTALGGVLYNKEAILRHDRSGKPYVDHPRFVTGATIEHEHEPNVATSAREADERANPFLVHHTEHNPGSVILSGGPFQALRTDDFDPAKALRSLSTSALEASTNANGDGTDWSGSSDTGEQAGVHDHATSGTSE